MSAVQLWTDRACKALIVLFFIVSIAIWMV